MRADHRWFSRLPHVFVIFALAALVIIPIIMNRRIADARKQMIGPAETARTFASDLQLALARELTTLLNLQLKRENVTVSNYDGLVQEQQRAILYLEQLAVQLGPSVDSAIATVRDRSALWHEYVGGLLDRDAPGGAVLDPRHVIDGSRHEQAIDASLRLQLAVASATQDRLYLINAAEQLRTRLTRAAVLLALVAALVTAWLGRRLRLVAEEAARRRAEVERLLDAKARLMRGITHDLKNPLNVIDGYAQLLAGGMKGELSPPQHESVARIRNGVRSSLGIINDLLEIARAESGELRLDRAPADLVQLARDAVEDHRGEIELAGLALDFRADVAQAVESVDADRVLGILSNLLSNVRKYTPRGGHVIVTATASARGPGGSTGSWVALAVSDDGPGIPPDRKEFIFEEFARLEAGTRGGAGLGLAISRAIARLMGGDLTVDSTPGVGSTFTLWVPASRAYDGRAGAHDAAAHPPAAEPENLAGVMQAVAARRDDDPPRSA